MNQLKGRKLLQLRSVYNEFIIIRLHLTYAEEGQAVPARQVTLCQDMANLLSAISKKDAIKVSRLFELQPSADW